MTVQAIQYAIGDATDPEARPAVIAHVCNDIGAWGAGFVKALSRRWPEPERAYRSWATSGTSVFGRPFRLGEVQFVEVEGPLLGGLWVANMVAQHDIRRRNGDTPIRYEALTSCLEQVADFALARQAAVVGPRFGAGLAGGDWAHIERIIGATLVGSGVPVMIYDLA